MQRPERQQIRGRRIERMDDKLLRETMRTNDLRSVGAPPRMRAFSRVPMSYPKTPGGAELCIAVTRAGVTVYGNPKAFKSLVDWMAWASSSTSKVDREFHLNWQLQTYAGMKSLAQRNVWVLVEDELKPVLSDPDRDPRDFEITFRLVDNKHLKQLKRAKVKGTLPANWEPDANATETPKPARRPSSRPRRR
jgi:hypothetical protein